MITTQELEMTAFSDEFWDYAWEQSEKYEDEDGYAIYPNLIDVQQFVTHN